MPKIIVPVAKMVFVCDDVVRDSLSGKVSALNLFERIRVKSSDFPYVLGKLCVFAQFRGGLGDVVFHVEIASTDSEILAQNRREFVLPFRDRMTTYNVNIRLRNLLFPSPGTYVIELYATTGLWTISQSS